MARSARLRVAWREHGPARPRRYLAWLIPIGVVHAALSAGATWVLDFDEAASFGEMMAIPMVPAAWATGWILRGRIAAGRGSEMLAITSRAVLLGAFLAGSIFSLLGGAIFLAEGDWLHAAVSVVFCWVYGIFLPVLGFLAVFPTVLTSLPLTWLAIVVLHRAAGGAIERPTRRREAAPLAAS